jgi:hypothetical protein
MGCCSDLGPRTRCPARFSPGRWWSMDVQNPDIGWVGLGARNARVHGAGGGRPQAFALGDRRDVGAGDDGLARAARRASDLLGWAGTVGEDAGDGAGARVLGMGRDADVVLVRPEPCDGPGDLLPRPVADGSATEDSSLQWLRKSGRPGHGQSRGQGSTRLYRTGRGSIRERCSVSSGFTGPGRYGWDGSRRCRNRNRP